MRSERYQIALIVLGLIAAVFFGVFFFRELFPEYRIYQNDYVALEKFRSTYTGEPPPAFREGVKQIVFEREDKGPSSIDRCTSCHVALQLPHFSATKIAKDINGNIVRDVSGIPVQEPNEDYIWGKLDQKIADLTDEKVNEQLLAQGASSKVALRLKEAKQLESLKEAKVGEHVYDVTKVLSMHPLIGKETRPFEFHPIDEYGCTVCHSGNGKGLTTQKAHGPVFDEQYEPEYMGPRPEFLEKDPRNDPQFARVFNDKPADSLLFQTNPLLVGDLIQAKCIQCHKQSATALQGLADAAGTIASKKERQADLLQKGYQQEVLAVLSLYRLQEMVKELGVSKTIKALSATLEDPSLPFQASDSIQSQLTFLKQLQGRDQGKEVSQKEVSQKEVSQKVQYGIEKAIHNRLVASLGKEEFVVSLEKILSEKISKNLSDSEKEEGRIAAVGQFLKTHNQEKGASGSLFMKWDALNLERALLRHVQETNASFAQAAGDESVVSSMADDVDALTKNYWRGQQLYLSQGCYACHRIAGFSRGGVGPELTRAGGLYPWYMKEKLTWPQGSLRASTMPNMHLDHMEVQDLMSFLLGQNGATKAVSQTDYKTALQEWEAGKKQAFEKPISPSQMHDLRYAMTVFTTQGCAACHRLKGFESNVGYAIEKQKESAPSFDALYQEKSWFQNLFPESITGSEIVKAIEQHREEIDLRIVDDVRSDSLLEELEMNYPQSVQSLYSEFRYAARAKNQYYEQALKSATNPQEKALVQEQLEQWKKRVHRLLMMYVQEYGLGRLIGPRPNWSGIYRSDQWLMEHFRNPSGHVPNSIMPILPFDDTKFYALTYMLDTLGKKNRDEVKEIWEHRGFDPSIAFHIFCAQCHGDYLQGNGPVSTWIYPIPKSLRDAEFLRNLTKEQALFSIMHGVKGTPMAPWGETPEDKFQYDGVPVLNEEQVHLLVDWLYAPLPGGSVIKGAEDVPKWQYSQHDIMEELKREKNELQGAPLEQSKQVDKASLSVFDVVESPVQGEKENAYYIKKRFYTERNIEQGRAFFDHNCAVCHGKDADGAGARASIMINAKPRMLINLDWLKSRDDLRLLRSIKYGVPGTSMTPWGDMTSSLQRLQLVIYIRSLSQDNLLREQLVEGLYHAYAKSYDAIEKARAVNDREEGLVQQQFAEAKKQADALEDKEDVQNEKEQSEKAVNQYKQQLALKTSLKHYEAKDQKLLDLKKMVKREEDLYREMGMDMLSADMDADDWKHFFSLLSLNQERITFAQGKLALSSVEQNKISAASAKIISSYENKIEQKKKEKQAALGKIKSEKRTADLNELEAQVSSLAKAKRKMLISLGEIDLLHRKQEALLSSINDKK